jgi:hypothetical protein
MNKIEKQHFYKDPMWIFFLALSRGTDSLEMKTGIIILAEQLGKTVFDL